MTSNYSKILLTGATGWLGKRIVEALTKGFEYLAPVGIEVKALSCLVKPGEDASSLLELGAEVHYGDIVDSRSCKQFLEGSTNSLLIHTAGMIHPKFFTSDFMKVNVYGTENLVNLAAEAGVKRVIVISSNSPIGCNPSPEHRFTELSAYNPYMGYGRSKKIMELNLIKKIESELLPEITIIRPPWFYGPGQPPRQTEFFKMLRDGRFPIMGRGLNQRSMVFIDNLVLGVMLAGYKKRAAGQIYWIADQKPYSMVEITRTVRSVLKEDFGREVKDKNLLLPSIVSDVARTVDRGLQSMGLYNQKIHVLSEMNQSIACDITKAKNELGYEPIVELREGMRQSIEWCIRNGEAI